MTGRTHDLAAFAALTAVFVLLPQPPAMSLPTALAAFGANFLGGLFPDIDQKTSDFWDNFRLGDVVAAVICPLLGGHRTISHSLVGLILIGFGSHKLLEVIASLLVLPLDIQIIWISFMIGVISHILMDMPTKAGVPLFWPLKITVGIPPFRSLRIQSGTFLEHWVVFPLLLWATGYMLYTSQDKILLFVRQYLG